MPRGFYGGRPRGPKDAAAPTAATFTAVPERSSTFRAGVGMLVVNGSGLVLALERIDRPGAWQAPQGGLEPGESPLDAARRELREETGIAWDLIEVVAEHALWLGYELPPEARSARTGQGQVHKWFLLRYRGPDRLELPASRGGEFVAWRWIGLEQLVRDAWPVRRPVYASLAREWDRFFADR